MFTRTLVVTLVAASSFVLAGVQAISADEFQPEASVIGLGQRLVKDVAVKTPSHRAAAGRLSASR